MLKVGTRAPEFTLPDQDEHDTSLSTLLNRGTLILYFYPADFTMGCTRQAVAIRDIHEEILGAGLNIAGISPNSPERHRAFRLRYSLPFTLLSDTQKTVIEMYAVNGPLGFSVRRATYLIDPARFIRGTMLADFRISRHMDFIRRILVTSGR
jgi:peroxiredoxin Q/BCP